MSSLEFYQTATGFMITLALAYMIYGSPCTWYNMYPTVHHMSKWMSYHEAIGRLVITRGAHCLFFNQIHISDIIYIYIIYIYIYTQLLSYRLYQVRAIDTLFKWGKLWQAPWHNEWNTETFHCNIAIYSLYKF